MKDHAQAKIELINAAIKAADHIQMKSAFPLDDIELAYLRNLKKAVQEFKQTKEPNPPDRGDDDDWMDRHHGVG
jgi:hypothetical protein